MSYPNWCCNGLHLCRWDTSRNHPRSPKRSSSTVAGLVVSAEGLVEVLVEVLVAVLVEQELVRGLDLGLV